MACKLRQIVCITGPVSSLNVCLTECCQHISQCEYSYSIDNVVWSDWFDYDTTMSYVTLLNQDFFLRLRVYGNPSSVKIDNVDVPFTVSLAPSFDLTVTQSDNLYNPYANLDCAMSLYQSMTEMVSNIVGIPCWYFLVSPDKNSKDITFKEYCHLAVTAVKYIKIIIADGAMPSSKPDLDNYGISFMTDWEVELSRATFATAFGNMTQPQEGDLVYIPMMSRMWQVTSAYEEKKDGFMWNATTFKIYLRKYEPADAITTKDFEKQINSVVVNTYEKLFGDDTISANTETLSAPAAATSAASSYPVWEKDACRKFISKENIKIIEDRIYNKGILLADNWYKDNISITYQKKYCGSDATICFLLQDDGGSCDILSWSNHKIIKRNHTLIFNELEIELNEGTWFVWFRWSASLKIAECGASMLSLPTDIPSYRVRPGIYYLDFENAIKAHAIYSEEYITFNKTDITFNGNSVDMLSSIKFYDAYIDIECLLQQYPNSTHLLINDTARKLNDIQGYPSFNTQY